MNSFWKMVLGCGALSCGPLNSAIINAPFINDSGFFGSVDYLYWKLDSRVTPIATGSFFEFENRDIIHTDLRQSHIWDCGVRGAFGYTFCSGWSALVDYTYVNFTDHQDFRAQTINTPIIPAIGLLEVFQNI